MTQPHAIATLGSVRTEIVPDPELAKKGREAARALGRELARKGVRIIVYSGDPDFIECDVVAGYVGAADANAERMIEVHYPADKEGKIRFEEEATHPRLFQRLPHPSDHWQASFYRSFAAIAGVVIIGGGRSALTSGHVALALGLPVIALADFKGGAERIWRALALEPAYKGSDEHTLMSRWKDDSAAPLVEGLVRRCSEAAQAKARETAELKRLRRADALSSGQLRWAAMAGAAFLLLIIALLWGLAFEVGTQRFTILFVAALLLAGLSGALVRRTWKGSPAGSLGAVALFGTVAGFVVGIGYSIPSFVGGAGGNVFFWNTIDAGARLQLIIAVLTAFFAGFGFDLFLRRSLDEAAERIDASFQSKSINQANGDKSDR